MKRVSVVAVALAMMLAGSVATAEDPAAVLLGETAPSFQLEEVRTGEPHSLEDFRGKLVVLHFGASW